MAEASERKQIHPPAHLPALDGLRGVAILLVLASHAADLNAPLANSASDQWLAQALTSGWLGVDLFFVLSGFLITGILLATKRAPHYYKSFFARRFLRIFPLYYLLLAVFILMNRSQFHLPDIASLVFFYYNWQAVHLGHHLPNVNSLWSLAVEEQFYIVWPTLVLLLQPKRLIQLSLVGIALAFVFRVVLFHHSTTSLATFYLTPSRADGLLAGALIAIFRSNPVHWTLVKKYSPRLGWAAVAGIAAIGLQARHFNNFTTMPEVSFGMLFQVIVFSAVLIQCTQQTTIARLLMWHPLRSVGKYSYGMYMLHWPILNFIQRQIGQVHMWGKYVLCFILLLAATYLAALVSFNVYEVYFLRLKRRFPSGQVSPAVG